MNDQIVSTLKQKLRGRLVSPGDADYDVVRSLYNGMIDKRPRLIARCLDVADIIAAVRFGRDQGLPIAVRGGGHNGPGLGSCDGGLMVDLSMMRSVRVDPASRTVRVDPGCTSGDVDHATHAFGMAVPFGIVSTTGVAGLTLGGGTGYLTRKYGLTIDNLIEADIVLADGSLVKADKKEHPDLFWALRGGGGNFGVVTSFLFQAHPVETVYAGPIFWETAHAKAVMQAYRDFLPTAPEELYAFVGLKTVLSMDPFPEDYRGKRACAVISCYNGPQAEGEMILAKLLKTLPPPIFNWMQTMPFPAMQAFFDPFLPKGLQWYWKGDFVKSLPDEAIDTHIAQAAEAPSELSLMHLYPIDGAVHRVPKAATAWSMRDATWSMVIAGIDGDPGQADALKRWGRTYWAAIHPFNLEGAYVNFMMEDEVQGRVQAAYGENYQRLASVKAKYDPENIFRINQNIPPARY
ncbi:MULTISPECIES: FAD-binding oxidoreductase [Desulfococcus]|jgi:FAD/FMN-containing dehydrogenase|uniref:FAD linked oxidase domain-containing protein n=1 Tax=Desulfococcus multivorans DSM 2059 TaxID=1121405 RepID=S7V2T1_DESML|nr:FAD-binding oxidoreductase [Desulfococcus multivorans]AOY57033.1 FAD-linked oxidoreductase [Desulfococcus multivorans]AQU99548.1 oxidoreductase [Desulfococcus multivorans]EPR40769.1 FAD linked oxidase domain-containing protein [Desulfococcus multivorans DSM 2059]MDX9817825.1 FAD-binding oxidoreductase [Desulfococcus multivorans]SJZ89077.1 FAD/FMN-containing dehydrogenase [Desulfococcus multivorans DSM 2059]